MTAAVAAIPRRDASTPRVLARRRLFNLGQPWFQLKRMLCRREMFTMTPDKYPSESPPSASHARVIRTAPTSNVAVEQRLARAEQELRMQFTRIAQLQAELDLVVAMLRRSQKRAHRTSGILATA